MAVMVGIVVFFVIVTISSAGICGFCFSRKRRGSKLANCERGLSYNFLVKKETPPPPKRDDEKEEVTYSVLSKYKSHVTSASPSSPRRPPYRQLPDLDEEKCLDLPQVEHSFRSTVVQPNIREDDFVCTDSCSSSHSLKLPREPKQREDDLGSIYFNLSYDKSQCVLRLVIQKAVNLPVKDLSGSSDPFVKILLLPDRKNKLETRIKHKVLNPIWNEAFTFEGFPQLVLRTKTLYLQVIDYDRFSRNDPIGETELHLADVNLQQEPVPYVEKLFPCKRTLTYSGSFLVSLSFDPSTYYDRRNSQACHHITIAIMKCVNLSLKKNCDAYVKVYHMQSGKRLSKMKTRIKRNTLNPVWNESFEFDIDVNHIRETSFVLVVTAFDNLFPNEAIGQVTIGQQASGTPLKHWTDMMNNPNKSIAMWHKIVN